APGGEWGGVKVGHLQGGAGGADVRGGDKAFSPADLRRHDLDRARFAREAVAHLVVPMATHGSGEPHREREHTCAARDTRHREGLRRAHRVSFGVRARPDVLAPTLSYPPISRQLPRSPPGGTRWTRIRTSPTRGGSAGRLRVSSSARSIARARPPGPASASTIIRC